MAKNKYTINIYYREYYINKYCFKMYVFIFLNFSIIWNLNANISDNNNDSILSDFVKNIEYFNNQYPQEKVYLHFDNTAYYKGDTIWFKCYVINEDNRKFTDISRVLYVELLSSEGSVVDYRKLKIVNGQCHGEFELPNNCRSGYYEIRAYTRYMLNWGSDWIFSRVFPIFEKPQKEGNYSQSVINKYKSIYKIRSEREPIVEGSNKVNVTFYPEGGNLVLGLTSQVAFKAIDNNGQNLEVSGLIFENGVGIKKIEAIHQGMGVFDFCPTKENEEVVLLINDKKCAFNLPTALKNGYVMHFNNNRSNYLTILLEKSSELSPETLGLSVLSRGKVKYFKKVQLEIKPLIINIQKDSLSAGVNQITLFDRKGRILCERLLFIEDTQQKNILLLSDKKLYTPYELISLNFKTDPETIFSLSVREQNSNLINRKIDIYTEFLLSSDLKGYIQNPSYYFENPNDSIRKKALDILMLVQGWSRYNWKQQAAGDEFPYFHYNENGLILQGSIVSENDNKKEKIKYKKNKKEVISGNLDSIQLYLEDLERLSNGQQYRITIKLDSTGHFRILWPDFEGKCPIRLLLVDKSNPTTSIHACRFRILLDRVFDPVPRTYTFDETTVDYNITNDSYIEQENIKKEKRSIEQVQLLDDVILEDKVINCKIYDVDREKTRWRDQGIKYPETFWEYLNDNGMNIKKVLAINEVKSYGKFICYSEPEDDYKRDVLNVHDIPLYRPFIGSVYVDLGISKTGKWENAYDRHSLGYGSRKYSVSRIPLNQIKKIKVYDAINWTFIYPYDGLTYSSKKLDVFFEPYAMNDSIDDQIPHIRTTNLEGFSVSKDCYAGKLPPLPDYKDYRRTLYWNPNVKTGVTGNASVTFYNNSRCHEIIISAEGLTNEGVPIFCYDK